MPAKRILILAGTGEARSIAGELVSRGHHVISSLAGVTRDPVLPPGEVRSGGFGGAEGLVDFLKAERIEAVIDATHPFAAVMSAHAHEAALAAKVLLLRFERKAWVQQPGDKWLPATSMEHAASLLPKGARVMVTTGRKNLRQLFVREDLSGVIRCIEPPEHALPLAWVLLLDRPPHPLQAELALFRMHGITHLLTKNAGGDATRAKLDAARELGLPVLMIERPFKPQATCFDDVEQLVHALA